MWVTLCSDHPRRFGLCDVYGPVGQETGREMHEKRAAEENTVQRLIRVLLQPGSRDEINIYARGKVAAVLRVRLVNQSQTTLQT